MLSEFEMRNDSIHLRCYIMEMFLITVDLLMELGDRY